MAVGMWRDETTAVDVELTLDRVREGQVVRVAWLEEHDEDEDCRLRELGLYEGAQARVISHGDPVVLKLFGARLAVCCRCARHVGVVVE